MNFIMFLWVTLKLFSLIFVPPLAPNPGDAADWCTFTEVIPKIKTGVPLFLDHPVNTRYMSCTISAKVHYTDIGCVHVVQYHQRTSSQQFYNLLYNKFNTNGQKFATSQHLDTTSWHIEMLGSGIVMWQICCRIVVSLSVGGVVQHVRSRCPCSGVWH